jgi:phage-related baseplate assembly protein
LHANPCDDRREIRVVILSSEEDGTPSEAVLDAMRKRLTDDAIKLMIDNISVLRAASSTEIT